MFVVLVSAHVKPEYLQSFITATLNNASNSIQEPGVVRFNFYQQADDPTRFTLLEVYRSEDAPEKHRDTKHYIRWRDSVAEMLEEPRTKVTYNILFPPVSEW